MNAMDNVSATSASTAQAAAAQAQIQQLGLPPANLAGAASANTVNAELVSSVFGVDPAAVSGVYGSSDGSGGLFTGLSLLPVLQNLNHTDAEQALALLGIQTPTPVSSNAATGSAVSPAASPANASSGAAIVDPLWGKTA
jgi:hypothetical protein